MKKFRIIVNGKAYEVEVEEMVGMLSAASAAAPCPASKAAITPRTTTRPSKPEPIAVAPEPKSVSASAKSAEPAKPFTGKGEAVNAPMPGTVLEVKVALEQEVKEGDTLLVLEAMKMENEICAPNSGKISEILVNKGDSVNSGDVLVVING